MISRLSTRLAPALITVLIATSLVAWSLPASAAVDVSPPVIVSATLSQATVVAGQPFTVAVRATDDLSGVWQVCAYFEWADGRSDPGPGNCTTYASAGGTPQDGTWQISVPVPRFAVPGGLRGAYVAAYDSSGKVTTVNAPIAPVGGLSIAVTGGAPDTAPPAIGSAALSQSSVSVGQSFAVTVRATDDVSGAWQVCLGFRWADGRSDSGASGCGLEQPTSGTRQDGTWTIPVRVSQVSAPGVLRGSYVYVYDASGKRTEVNAPTAPVGDLAVTVTDATLPPVVCTPRPPVTVTSQRSGSGQLRVTVTATGAGNTIRNVSFGPVRNATTAARTTIAGASATFTVQRSSAGAVTVPFTVTDGCGEWRTFVGAGPSSI